MLRKLAASVGIADTELPESWKRNADAATAAMPETIRFLQDEYFERLRKRVALSEANAEWVREAMEWVRGNEPLRRLAWLWHFMLYVRPDRNRERINTWPAPVGKTPSGKRLEDVFPAVVLLSGYERLENMYKERNIPDTIAADTLSAVETCMNLYEIRTGFKGLGMHYLNWLQHCFNARLYKIGRLEFEMRAFEHPFFAYRRVKDVKITLLAAEGVKFRRDGLIDGTNDRFDAAAWTATLDETEDEIKGFPVHPDGYAVNRPVTLRKKEWQRILAPGDMTLNVHIPRKGAFTRDICQDAFVRAVDFFDTYYSEQSFSVFTCISWLMDPQLRRLLGPDSNLIRFQDWYHPFPVKSGDEGLYQFVFMGEKREIDQLPEHTSLQRKIKAFMRTGGRLHNGGGLLLTDTIRAVGASMGQ